MRGYAVAAGFLCALSLNAAERRVAFTFDDLPGLYFDNCDVNAFRQLNRKLVTAITRNGMPALGLVNGSHLCEARRDQTKSLLKIWLDAGLQIGSHTYTHPDFNTTSLERFQADIIANEKYLPPRPLYFRFPFLRSGTELVKKRAIEDFLAKRGYTNAVVTIDNDEYIYAFVYARAVRRGDKALANRIADDYTRYMESAFAFYEQLSRDTFGYEIPQILLLHANSLNADHLDRLAHMAKRRGYRFISIDEALRDPVYSRKENYIGGRGLSHIQRWAMEEGKKPPMHGDVPPWVMDLYRADTRR